jgi:diguanylate cyclase (GGDEF)-like protein
MLNTSYKSIVENEATLLFNEGSQLGQQGKHTEALAAYNKAVQLKPDYVDAWYYLGSSLEELGHYEQALANYDKVTHFDIKHLYAWYRRGNLLLRKLKRYDEAVAAYDKFIQLHPTDYEGWYFRGDALLHLQQYSEAVSSYGKAVHINPTSCWEWCERVNNLQELQQQQSALSLCKVIASVLDNMLALGKVSDWERDTIHQCWYVLADCFLLLESYDLAADICKKALQSKPDERLFWYSLAKALELLQRYEEAGKCYERAMEIQPNFLEATKGFYRVLVQQLIKQNEQLQQEIGARLVAEAALKKANQELESLVNLDSLTHVPNRRRFEQCLTTEWGRMAREKGILSLIFCDVDFFKLYNDTYGHPAGDICLKLIAQAISGASKRPGDLVARYGGEEFVVILPNTGWAGAIKVAREIKQRVQHLRLVHAHGIQGYVTLSMGIASTVPTKEIAPDTLVACADRALYQSKMQGRNAIKAMTLNTHCTNPAARLLAPMEQPKRLLNVSAENKHLDVADANNEQEEDSSLVESFMGSKAKK